MLRVVALLERVQGGIIGQTLSSFGITGLYITFVFGIGRFLRFSTQHARMRIPFEDLPTTKRLIALCQVWRHPEFSACTFIAIVIGNTCRCQPHAAHVSQNFLEFCAVCVCLCSRSMLLLSINVSKVLFASSKPALGLVQVCCKTC